MAPTYFIKKRIQAKSLIEATIREREAEVLDVWYQDEDGDDVWIDGFCMEDKPKKK